MMLNSWEARSVDMLDLNVGFALSNNEDIWEMFWLFPGALREELSVTESLIAFTNGAELLLAFSESFITFLHISLSESHSRPVANILPDYK